MTRKKPEAKAERKRFSAEFKQQALLRSVKIGKSWSIKVGKFRVEWSRVLDTPKGAVHAAIVSDAARCSCRTCDGLR